MFVSTKNLIRILIVEDNQFLIDGLTIIINDEPDMKVVGKANTGSEGLNLALCENPDLVLLDIGLGDVCGIDIIPDLINKTNSKVLVMTGMPVFELYEEALLNGARGVMIKDNTADVLLHAIRKVMEGEIWLSDSIKQAISIENLV